MTNSFGPNACCGGGPPVVVGCCPIPLPRSLNATVKMDPFGEVAVPLQYEESSPVGVPAWYGYTSVCGLTLTVFMETTICGVDIRLAKSPWYYPGYPSADVCFAVGGYTSPAPLGCDPLTLKGLYELSGEIVTPSVCDCGITTLESLGNPLEFITITE